MSLRGGSAAARTRVRTRFLAGAALGALGLVALRRPLGGDWLLGAAPIGLFVAAYAGTHLSSNRSSAESDLHPTLGPANAITLFRGWLVAVLGGTLVSAPSRPWLQVGLFAAAVLLDAVDGAVARLTRETVLGARLDSATDALVILVGAAVAVAGGSLPTWYLLAGGVWYAYAGSLWIRKRSGAPVYELPPSRIRPLVGSVQFLVIAVGLLPGVDGTARAALAIGAGLALAALLASFARDWAAATGRLGRDDPPVPEG